MKCSDCKFLYTLPIDKKSRQEYYVCEKGIWSGVEVAFGKDYGVDCKEFKNTKELEEELLK